MDALRGSEDKLLRAADLAEREDFKLGETVVSPSTRAISGPGGSTSVEPRIMQVLVVLADAAGHVVTRDILFQRCWGGVYVGDDSLNRVIATVRKLASEIANGSFAVGTVPRTGYKLTVLHGATPRTKGARRAAGSGISRRGALIAGSAVAALGGLGLWSALNSRADRRFDDMLNEIAGPVRSGRPDWDAERTTGRLRQAVAARPDSAKAWGLLALVSSLVAQGDGKISARALEEAKNAARRALAIDAKEPNALLAMFELQGSTLDWATRDRRLRAIIAIDPTNLIAIGELTLMLQATGLSRESWNWNERALALDPLSLIFLGRRALKLWIAGRVPEADQTIDQLRALYPTNPGPWFVRFLILALTGRPRAAQAMLDPDPARLGSPQDVKLWRASLAALEQSSPETIGRAREACYDAAKSPGGSVGDAVMILSALGEVDAAFDVVNGFVLSRGAIVRRGAAPSNAEFNEAVLRINTQLLFTPPCAVMRADPRFLPLCEAMGLGDYWRGRGVKPDYLLAER
jgi:DNA-binding winged helix-turn-helix (wHTH) protein/tetratricopeptide (TPR) repeat protein